MVWVALPVRLHDKQSQWYLKWFQQTEVSTEESQHRLGDLGLRTCYHFPTTRPHLKSRSWLGTQSGYNTRHHVPMWSELSITHGALLDVSNASVGHVQQHSTLTLKQYTQGQAQGGLDSTGKSHELENQTAWDLLLLPWCLSLTHSCELISSALQLVDRGGESTGLLEG